jgi:hypothetical protein
MRRRGDCRATGGRVVMVGGAVAHPADSLELLVMVFGKRYVKGITYAIIIKTHLNTQTSAWQQ